MIVLSRANINNYPTCASESVDRRIIIVLVLYQLHWSGLPVRHNHFPEAVWPIERVAIGIKMPAFSTAHNELADVVEIKCRGDLTKLENLEMRETTTTGGAISELQKQVLILNLDLIQNQMRQSGKPAKKLDHFSSLEAAIAIVDREGAKCVLALGLGNEGFNLSEVHIGLVVRPSGTKLND
jgi:hypothetical protein